MRTRIRARSSTRIGMLEAIASAAEHDYRGRLEQQQHERDYDEAEAKASQAGDRRAKQDHGNRRRRLPPRKVQPGPRALHKVRHRFTSSMLE